MQGGMRAGNLGVLISHSTLHAILDRTAGIYVDLCTLIPLRSQKAILI